MYRVELKLTRFEYFSIIDLLYFICNLKSVFLNNAWISFNELNDYRDLFSENEEENYIL